jgi:hypothetical protein
MLILKNEIKEVFKTLGMPEGLTVTRGAGRGPKFVSISGQCGEPILTITKVEVGAKLTKVEREILILDYIVPALTVNKEAILDYIKLRKDTSIDDDLKELKAKYPDMKRRKYWDGTQKGYEYVSISGGVDNCEIYMTQDGSFEVSISRLPEGDFKQIINSVMKIAKSALPEYMRLLDLSDKREDSLRTAKRLLNEMCDF